MPTYDLWMMGHTTQDISSVNYVHSFVNGFANLFGKDEIAVHWLDESSSQSKKRNYSRLSERDITEIYGRGAIAFTDPDEKTFDAGIEWNKVCSQERKNFLAAQGYRQNNFVLKSHAFLVEEKVFREKYIEFCKEQSAFFDVTYLYVYHPRLSRARSTTKLGLGEGLQNVYWVNVFGPPYVKMIGADRLLGCPAESVQRIGDNHILVQATGPFLDPTSSDMEKACRRIRDHIGEDFFVRNSEEQTDTQAQGAMSILGIFKLLYSAKRDFESTTNSARRRPEFDFSDILIDE